MILQTWGDVIIASLQQVWTSVASFVPLLIGSVVIFIIGWIVAVALGKVVEQIVRAVRLDKLLSQLEIEKMLERAGWKIDTSMLLGHLVKWFVIIAFLLASTNILGLTQVSDFLSDVLLYVPNVVIAVLILIIAAIVSDVVERLARSTLQGFGHGGAMAGVVVRWSILIFAFTAALMQLGIAVSLIQTLITGLVASIAIAAGIAFGLGGKDAAAGFIDKVRGELRK